MRILLMSLVILVGAESAVLFIPSAQTKKKESPFVTILRAHADKILQTCATTRYRPACYDEEIPKLMDAVSMEDAFEVTRLVQDRDTAYTYCHVLGHALSAHETAKDPDMWKEVITRCPRGLCSNGCIHGAFQERFRAETLTGEQIDAVKPEFVEVCEEKPNWRPTGLEQATCYHALGHLLMYVSGADTEKSVALCEEIGIKSKSGGRFTPLCFDGVFMQIFQPLEPDDFALIKGKEVTREIHPAFCKPYTGIRLSSCWNEGWPLYREQIIRPDGLVKFCTNALLPADFHDACYQDLFYVITAQLQFDETRLRDFCNRLPRGVMPLCFANVSSRMIETDWRNTKRAADFCSSAKDDASKNRCFQELLNYSTYNFHQGSAEFLALCDSLPGAWRAQCLGR